MSNKIIDDAVATLVARDIAGEDIGEGAGKLWLIERTGSVDKAIQSELDLIEENWSKRMKDFKSQTPPVKEDSPAWKSAFELYEAKVNFQRLRMKAVVNVLPK